MAPSAELAPEPAAIMDRDARASDERRLFARRMEVFAGFGEQANAEIGWRCAAVDERGATDSPRVVHIMGDTGASPEGGLAGVVNEVAFFSAVPESLGDQLGEPNTCAHAAAGWAIAGNTPVQDGIQPVSSPEGNQNPMVIRWPARIRDCGGARMQVHHVIDIAPTVLEMAGLPRPTASRDTPAARTAAPSSRPARGPSA